MAKKKTLRELSFEDLVKRGKETSRIEKAYKMPSSLKKEPVPKEKTLYFTGPKEFGIPDPLAKTYQQKKDFVYPLSEGDYKFVEKHFVQIVKRAYEKYGKKNVKIAHQNDPSNEASQFVDKLSKKHGFKQEPPAPVESFGKDGAKKRDALIQKAIDRERIIPITFSKEADIKLGKKDKNLYNKAREEWNKITQEKVINKKGRIVSKWRKASKYGKNTQENTVAQAFIDQRQDLRNNPKEVQATDEVLKEKQEFTKKKFGNESNRINTHYLREEGVIPEEGKVFRKEIDDYSEEAKPRKKVIVKKPRIPYRRDYWAKVPGLGKPLIQKLPDVTDLSQNRTYVENFDQDIDDVAKLRKGKQQGEALINYSKQDITNKRNVAKNAVSKGTLLTSKRGPLITPELVSKIKKPNTDNPFTRFFLDKDSANLEFTKDDKLTNIRAKSIKDFTDNSMDIDSPEDKTKSGSGYETHKKSHLERIELEDKKDMENLEKTVQRHKRSYVLSQSEAVAPLVRKRHQSIITNLNNEFPDSLAMDALSNKPGEGVTQTKSVRSATTYDDTIKDVPIPRKNIKVKNIEIKSQIAEGPKVIGYNIPKLKITRQNKTGLVTSKARSSILTSGTEPKTLSKFPLTDEQLNKSLTSKKKIEETKTPISVRNKNKNIRKTLNPTKFMGGFVLGGLISGMFAKKNLQAKGIKKPTTKQLAQETTSSFIGFPRIFGGVGEDKGYLQNVSLMKKGVSGKRRSNNAPIKGAGGDDTPYASLKRFFSPSRKNVFKNRTRN